MEHYLAILKLTLRKDTPLPTAEELMSTVVEDVNANHLYKDEFEKVELVEVMYEPDTITDSSGPEQQSAGD